MILVNDLYNELAIITGFPIYSTENDTPDTTRFLLNTLSQSLNNVIDILYTSNNVLQRTDKIITIPSQNKYGIEGIIKNLAYKDPRTGLFRRIPYNDRFNPNQPDDGGTPQGEPQSYCISGGYLRLLPTPDKEYELNVTVSTTDLVWTDNDTSRTTITSINDAILANKDLAEIVLLRAAVLVFARCRNQNMQIYQELCTKRLQTFIEKDYGTVEAQRGMPRNMGNYDSSRGLLGW